MSETKEEYMIKAEELRLVCHNCQAREAVEIIAHALSEVATAAEARGRALSDLESDKIPRSRYEALNSDWLESERQRHELAERSIAEIERLNVSVAHLARSTGELLTRAETAEQFAISAKAEVLAAETRGQAIGLERAAEVASRRGRQLQSYTLKIDALSDDPTVQALRLAGAAQYDESQIIARDICALSPDPDYAKRLLMAERERIAPIIKTLVQDFARQDRIWQLDLADILAAIDKEGE